jgi:cytochrome c oxidase subunit II
VNPHVILAILIAVGVAWTAVWAIVLLRSRRQIVFATIEKRLRRLQLVLLGSFLIVGAAAFVVMLRWLPYRNIRFAGLGKPRVSVEATGMQWTWMLSGPRIPANVPVEFVVRARDVNHDFGIYNSQGELLTQVQAMPGYTNRLVYVFRAPGTYTVRCLEYCGLGHHLMTTSLAVTKP